VKRGEPLPGDGVLAMLERGRPPNEEELLRTLRSSRCPAALVERLAGSRFVLASRRLLPLVVSHPACPRHFAWDSLPRLGWRDLAAVSAATRTPPPVRRQAEKKLAERVAQMTLGERLALARVAPRSVVGALLHEGDARCIAALLDNAKITESDAARIVSENGGPGCAMAVLRHARWGGSRLVRAAALRSPHVPLVLAMGLLATLTAGELALIAGAHDVPAQVRDAARNLFDRRADLPAAESGPAPPCTRGVTP
jgi:hypothetical protein